jgi:hypothetical protein
MAQWGNTDDAANSALWATAAVNLTSNTTNQAALYANTTQQAFNNNGVAMNKAVGQFGYAVDETVAARAGAGAKVAHAGWNLRTVGSGGRAGRVQTETLVAMRTITSDGDNGTIANYLINITAQPSSASANSSANARASFQVTATTTPTGGTLGYFWQKRSGSSWANLTNTGAYSNTTTRTLSVLANTASNGEIYRVGVTNTKAATVYSSNAVITITT